MVIALAVLLPVFVLSDVVIHQSVGEIAFAEKELKGTAYLRRAWDVVSVCDAGLVPARSGSGASDRGGVLPVLEAEGNALLSGLSHRNRTCDKARLFLRRIADESNLMLDPRPDTYCLMHGGDRPADAQRPRRASHGARQ